MNEAEAADLQAALRRIRPVVRVDAHPRPQGASLSIEGRTVNGSASSGHTGNRVQFDLSDDGPLIRFLRNLELHP
jgi:hypothetical protein